MIAHICPTCRRAVPLSQWKAHRIAEGVPATHLADLRYASATCPKCQHDWQLMDWHCAAHQLTCGYPIPRVAD
jgi:hypothetical protein